MKGRKLRVEDLLVPRILEVIGELEGRPAVDEGSATIALHPVIRALFDPWAGAQAMFGISARTAILFVVDHEEFQAAVSSALEAPLMPELPPLPYPRVAVECAEDATWAMGGADVAHEADLEAFTINEEERGERWQVCMLLRNPMDDADEFEALQRAARTARTRDEMTEIARHYGQRLAMFEINGDGGVTFFGKGDAEGLPQLDEIRTEAELRRKAEQIARDFTPGELMREEYFEPDDGRAIGLRSIPIEFAHLVNARGVTLEEIPVARPQRRRFERKRLVHPKLYFVLIGGTSEEREGRSDREYHCRWLVRGHWRRFVSGDKTWVRPYIKGPAGAPWKGRPVYITAAAAGR